MSNTGTTQHTGRETSQLAYGCGHRYDLDRSRCIMHNMVDGSSQVRYCQDSFSNIARLRILQSIPSTQNLLNVTLHIGYDWISAGSSKSVRKIKPLKLNCTRAAETAQQYSFYNLQSVGDKVKGIQPATQGIFKVMVRSSGFC